VREDQDLILTIDVGTTNLKCILHQSNGRPMAALTHSHPTTFPHPAHAEQLPSTWIENLKQLLKAMSTEYSEWFAHLQGISLTGQMHGPVCLGKTGEVLFPCIIWSDTRARNEATFLKQQFSDEFFLQVTGNPVQESFTLPKILWLKNHQPDLYRQITTILFPKDYLGYRLTGSITTDHSDASGSLLYDLHRKSWSEDLIMNLGIDPGILPPIVDSDTIIGHITQEASEAFHIPFGIPVIKGGGDLATTALATGAGSKETISLCIGTAAQLLMRVKTTPEHFMGKLYRFAHCIKNASFYLGTVPTGGSSLQWLTSLLGKDATEELYHELDTLTKIPLDRHLLFYPYLMGSGTPHFDYQVQGAFLGLQIYHHSRDLALAIMEGVTMALKESLDCITDQEIQKVIMSGGAVRFTIWPRIVSQIFQLPVTIAKYSDSASFGAFLLAAHSFNYIDNFEKVDDMITTAETYFPEPDLVRYYEKMYNAYKSYWSAIHDYPKFFLSSTD